MNIIDTAKNMTFDPDQVAGNLYWDFRRIKSHQDIKAIEDIRGEDMPRVKRIFDHSEKIEGHVNDVLEQIESEGGAVQNIMWLFHPNMNYEIAIIWYYLS